MSLIDKFKDNIAFIYKRLNFEVLLKELGISRKVRMSKNNVLNKYHELIDQGIIDKHAKYVNNNFNLSRDDTKEVYQVCTGYLSSINATEF